MNCVCRQYDWGGAIQVRTDEDRCMWKIFGIMARNYMEPNCSAHRKPAIFTDIESQLGWLENIIFDDFRFDNIMVKQPQCNLPTHLQSNRSENRCPSSPVDRQYVKFG